MKKKQAKKLSKALTITVVIMMLLQSIGMSGIASLAASATPDATDKDTNSTAASAPSAEVPAPDQTPIADPAPAKVQPSAVDATAVTIADPTKDLAPSSAKATQSAVEATAPAPTDTTPKTTDATTGAIEDPVTTPTPTATAPAMDGKDTLTNPTDITTSVASDWEVDGDMATTKVNVKLGVKYEFPGDKDVSVTFTKLPKDESRLSTLKIEQIASDKINLPDGVVAATDFAYDITTDMQNGDFKYDLTLPKAKDSSAEVKYIEKSASEVVATDTTENELKDVDETKVKEDKSSVGVSELDHFTVFLLTTNQTIGSSGVTNPDKGWVSDNQYAVFTGAGASAEYGFSDLGVPANSIIDGIEVTVEGKSSSIISGRDLTVELWNTSNSSPAAYSATQTANMNYSEATVTVGGATNKWGKTWTAADFADATFKIRVKSTTSGSGDVSLDAVTVKVDYTTVSTTGTLIVNKIVANDNSGTKTASDFSFSINGAAAVPFNSSGSNSQTVSAGTYSVTEPAVSGYTASYGNSLNANTNCTSLVIPAGGTVTCTITNDDNAPAYVSVAGNVIANPSFETGSGNSATGWRTDNTGSTATFSIAPGAHSGNRAAKIQVTAVSGGDAKWLFDSVPVTAGQYYTFIEYYKSSVPTEVDLFNTGGSDQYQFVSTLPAAATWTKFQTSFLVPTGVTAISVAHILASVGTLSTDDYSMVLGPVPVFTEGGMVSLTFDDGLKSLYTNGVPVLNAAGYKATAYINTTPVQAGDWSDYMNSSEVISLYNQGYDIGGHSTTHSQSLTNAGVDLNMEINDNRTYLKSILPVGAPVDSFAYPFGDYNDTVIAQVTAAGYLGARSVEDGINLTDANKYTLKAREVDGNTTVATVKSWIDEARTQKAWLILLFHDVKNGDCPNSAASYCTNKTTLQEIVAYLASQHMTVPTVHQGLAVMGGSPIPDTIAPILAETTPVAALTNDATPSYTFSSTEAGTITYGGSCISAQTAAVAGFNTITFNTLAAGAHSDCIIQVKDAANNTSLALTVSAFTVDMTVPVITVAPYNTDPTNADILVSASTNKGTLNAIEHLFTANGSFDFVATDAAGNVTTSTVTISNINKNSPVITLGDYVKSSTNQDITVGATTDHGTLNADSHVFTANGSFDFVATDDAQNSTTKTVTITNIDKDAPVINMQGENPVTITAGDSFIDPGASASDNVDGSVAVQTSGSVDAGKAGDYAITYAAADAAGNTAAALVRAVHVKVKPVTTDTPTLAYSISKKAKKNVTFFFADISLSNKKYVTVQINGKKMKVLTVRRGEGGSYVTVAMVYNKWGIGNYSLKMSYKNQIKVAYIQKGKTKYKNGWETGGVNSDNILSII